MVLADLAFGDAFGAGYEGVRERIRLPKNSPLKYVKHPRHSVTPGNYTDDTQMASVVAEVMLSSNFTKQKLADGWVRRFKEDKRPGYTKDFYNFLKSCKNGSEFLRDIKNGSVLSGAAMRAPPIGLYSSKKNVKQNARLQAKITHRDGGVKAAVASALMVHYFAREGGSKKGLRDYIAEEVDARYGKDWSKNRRVGTEGWQCVSAAISAVEDNNNIPALLRQCVEYGGDTDTVAAIAMAAASCSSEYRDQHNKHGKGGWNKRIPGKFGRNYLEGLDKRMWRAVRQRRL